MRALDLGRLLRLSLAPTALADVAAGTVLGARAWPDGLAPFALMLASSCVYHGAMALNDWADRAEDARVRPGRPIPSGAIAPSAALLLAIALLAGGPLLARAVEPRCGLVLGAVALCAAFYDLAGRGAWLGPLLLGLCRAGNLCVGLVYAGEPSAWRAGLWCAPCAYGLYVFLVSRLARLEDVAPERYESGELRPQRWAFAAGLALFGIGVVALVLRELGPHSPVTWATPRGLGVFLAGLGAVGLLRAVRAIPASAWRARDVQRMTGMALRRLLVASAALATAAGTFAGIVVALAILCGYPLSFALRRVFPPT